MFEREWKAFEEDCRGGLRRELRFVGVRGLGF